MPKASGSTAARARQRPELRALDREEVLELRRLWGEGKTILELAESKRISTLTARHALRGTGAYRDI